ncbi:MULTISPECIES: hypothetical protein [Natrialba]|uniref:Uncharacterized protein n=3 Tax=Natrialba TaxID=63742 RepID=M0ARR7_NATA1|nr:MULTISPECIES: hypothetical protein [Natrialba]ELY85578.1 hypothetical protein C484_19707 [Natrialba taiwanensis DSM 12281]ELZ01002.1 hypothetical protein C481_10915 [Natrialba asiatica DSM 12278]ELZ10317.1 hypothetical protein C480_01215 [Natrialba aegyptia DSM 13077]
MDVPARNVDPTTDDELDLPAVAVSCHETRPGKIVFTEQDNNDGWIATDLTVDLEP